MINKMFVVFFLTFLPLILNGLFLFGRLYLVTPFSSTDMVTRVRVLLPHQGQNLFCN